LKNKLLLLSVFVFLFALLPTVLSASVGANGTIEFSRIEKEHFLPGESFQLRVSITNNTGVASIPLRLTVPDGLELTGVTPGAGISGDTITEPEVYPATGTVFVSWYRAMGNFTTQNADLFTFTFRVSQNARYGETGNIVFAFATGFGIENPSDQTGTGLDVLLQNGGTVGSVMIRPNHAVTVIRGTAAPQAYEGENVLLRATPQDGQVFLQWISLPAVNFINPYASETSFTMIDEPVTITAVFRDDDKNDGGLIRFSAFSYGTPLPRGRKFDVTARIENNPGFSTMGIRIDIPEGLILTGITPLITGNFIDSITDPITGAKVPAIGSARASWFRSTNFTGDANLITFSFEVSENAQHGLTDPIRFFFADGDGDFIPKDSEGNDLNISIANNGVIGMIFVADSSAPSGVFLTPLQAALVAAVAPSVENPAIPANLGATQLTLGELAGLRRFNVRGLNWANPAFLVERNAIGAAQRAVIERMLEGAAEVGASGAFFDSLTPLQLALARAVTPSTVDPAIPANLGATQLTLGELAGLRRFNVRGLNWANSAFLVERNAIGSAQRAVIERMLDALND
jgi:hypothetical protein